MIDRTEPHMLTSNLESIKVIYDISVLGQGHLHSRARTGIFRVVESLAEGLTSSPECDLLFSVSQYFQLLDASLDYLQSNPKLAKVPLLHSSFSRIFYKKLLDTYNLVGCQTKINEASNVGEDKLFLDGVKTHLENTLRMMGGYSNTIDSRNLEEVDIFHSPYDQIPASVQTANNVQAFLTIYDLIPILYPEFLLSEQIPLLYKQTLASISQKDWVTCISHSTKNDLCNYLNIDESRVFVTPLAAEPSIFYPCGDATKLASTRSKYGIPDAPYLLSLGTLEPRKNLDGAIRSFAKLIEQQNITDLYLVLVGTPGWKYDNIMAEVSRNNFLKQRIIFTGYVPESDLAALYSSALAFVYPSFYEGFGLPPLEAMQCGIPVITSNTSSLPEVVGDAGIMVDPKDTDALCHSMLEIYNNSFLRASMSLKSLAQAKLFSWERCTQQTIAAYRTALS
jgi:glycosyltransferase involved in cell wall biosynthesis